MQIVEGFDAEDFKVNDFRALLAFERKTRIDPMAEALAQSLQKEFRRVLDGVDLPRMLLIRPNFPAPIWSQLQRLFSLKRSLSRRS